MAASLHATHGPHGLLQKGLLSKADLRSCMQETAAQGRSCTATCCVGRQLTDSCLRRGTMFWFQRAAGGRQRCVARHLSTFARALASPNPQASRGSQARPPFPSPKTCHSGEPQSNPDRSDNGSGGNGFGSQLSPQDSGIEAPGEAGSTAEKRPPVAAVLAEMRQRLNRANGKRGGVAGHSDGPAETSGKQAAMSDVTGYRERPHLPAFKHAPPTALLSTPAPQTAVERVAEGPPFMSELPSAKSDLYPSTPSEEMGNGYHKASNLQDGFGTGVAKSHSQELSESALQSSPQSFRTTPLRTPPPSTPLSSNSSWSFPPSLSPSRRYPDVSSASPPLEVRPDPADAASSSAPQDSPNGVSSVRRLPPMKLRSRSLFRRSGVLREERSENGASTSDRGPGDERSRTSDDRTASSGSVLRTAEASDVETGQFGTRERILTERNGSSVEGLHAGTREGFGDEAVPEGKLEGSVPLTEWMHDSRASEPLSSVEESRDLQPLSVLENAEVISETERLVSDAERRSLDTDDGAPLTEWLRIFGNSSGARESGDSQPIELSGSSDSSQETGTSQTEVENNSQIGVGVSEAELRVGGGEGAPLTEWLTPSRGDRAVLSPDELSVLSSEAPLTEWRPEPSTAGNGVGRTERASPETSFRVPIPLVEPAPSVRNGQRTFPRFLPKGSDRPAFRGELLTGTLSNSEPADRSLFSVNDSDALKALEHPGALTGSNGAEPFSDGAESTSDASQPLPGGHQNVLKSSSSVSDGSQRVLDVSKSLLDASQSFSDGSQSVANVSKSLLDAFSVVTDASPSVLDGPKSVSDGSDEQRTPEWYAVRRWRLTASAFASAVGFFPEQRLRLWEEKLELREPFRGNQMTVWGTKQETPALEQYARITGNQVAHQSFQVYKEPDDVYTWLGASPDGLIAYDSAGLGQGPGVLEVKCPFGREGPEMVQPYPSVPHYYMPQVQGLMEIFDRQWADFFVWTVNGSVVFRVERDPAYWALLFPVLSHFWWQHVVPAKHEMVHGRKDPDTLRTKFEPQPKDVRTELIIAESKRLSARSPVIWTDSGRVQNGRDR